MDYEAWWPLHIRAAKGETFSQAESAILNAAYADANRDESNEASQGRNDDLAELRKLRDEVRSLQANILTIQKQRRRNAVRIRRLEAELDPEAREAIGRPSGL